MKEIMAIIRMNMVNKTKEALALEGYPGFTCRKVLGRGKSPADYEMMEDIVASGGTFNASVGEALTEEHRLLSKRWFTVMVKDEDKKRIIDAIIRVNQTGSMGDGKIFVLPVEEVVRIRTGEIGEEAI